MRTDSTNLSEDAMKAAKEQIITAYGAEFSNPRKYTKKSKGAQEAHEAIRPTYMQDVLLMEIEIISVCMI